MNQLTSSLLDFLNASPCNFLAVNNISAMLGEAGFTELRMTDEWNIKPGGRYFVTQNNSAIFAFVAGTGTPASGYKFTEDRFSTHGSTVRSPYRVV